MEAMDNDSDGVTNRLRRTRVKLLAAAMVAAFVALMLPGAASEERVLKRRVEPVYPELARLLDITGVVRLALTMDCVGRVIHVLTLSGEAILATAAVEAARQWRFSCGAGQATVNVEIDFEPCWDGGNVSQLPPPPTAFCG